MIRPNTGHLQVSSLKAVLFTNIDHTVQIDSEQLKVIVQKLAPNKTHT
jgi:hypothetical protein